jgi:hypothetical protein
MVELEMADNKDFKAPTGRRPISKATEEFVQKLGHDPQYYGAQYLNTFTNPEKLKQRIEYAVRALKGHDFDSIAFSGMSGALIGPPVALAMDKTFLMVRKEGVDTHSYLTVEGDYAAKKYVILDDFSETGRTALRIKYEIGNIMPNAKCIGMLGVKWLTSGVLSTYGVRGKTYPLEQV